MKSLATDSKGEGMERGCGMKKESMPIAHLFLFSQNFLQLLHQPLANDSSSPQRGYSPPRVAEGGAGGAPSSSVDPFAGSDAFGAAGEFRPPSASTSGASAKASSRP